MAIAGQLSLEQLNKNDSTFGSNTPGSTINLGSNKFGFFSPRSQRQKNYQTRVDLSKPKFIGDLLLAIGVPSVSPMGGHRWSISDHPCHLVVMVAISCALVVIGGPLVSIGCQLVAIGDHQITTDGHQLISDSHQLTTD